MNFSSSMLKQKSLGWRISRFCLTAITLVVASCNFQIFASASETVSSFSIAEHNFFKIVLQKGVCIMLDPNFNSEDPRVWNEPEQLEFKPVIQYKLGSSTQTLQRTSYFNDSKLNTSTYWWDWHDDSWLFFTQRRGGLGFSDGWTFSYGIRKTANTDLGIEFGAGVGACEEKTNNPHPNALKFLYWLIGPQHRAVGSYFINPKLQTRPYWGAVQRNSEEVIFGIQDLSSFEVWSIVAPRKERKLFSYDGVISSGLDILISGDHLYLLMGDGKIRKIGDVGVEETFDLSTLPNWRKDAESACFYIFDREQKSIHFLWQNGGYGILQGNEFQALPRPGKFREIYEVFSPLAKIRHPPAPVSN